MLFCYKAKIGSIVTNVVVYIDEYLVLLKILISKLYRSTIFVPFEEFYKV